MIDTLGDILREYEQRMQELRHSLSTLPPINDRVFQGFESWERLLTFKLAPRLAGEGCLVVAVAGGTNTGKSTVFNCVLGENVSPISPYGAYTRHPIVAANRVRFTQCLERGKLLPDLFIPRPWDAGNPEAVTDDAFAAKSHLETNAEAVSAETSSPAALFVVQNNDLPDRMVLLDTPDIDSIAKGNWELAKNVREAGDVLIAVLTSQKYADACVVEFFREALASGRLVVPLMNMGKEDVEYREVMARQIEEFRQYIGVPQPADTDASLPIQPPTFFIPFVSRGGGPLPPAPVEFGDGHRTLMDYLESLDVVALKNRILSDSLRHFTEQADAFFKHADTVAHGVRQCIDIFEEMGNQASAAYEPKPGREVVTVVHDFIQQHASWPDRLLGVMTAQMLRLPAWFMAGFRSTFRRRIEDSLSEGAVRDGQTKTLVGLVAKLYGDYLTSADREVREALPEAAAPIADALRLLDPNAVAETIVTDTLRTEEYIGAYREFAFKELEARWNDRSFRWKLRLLYDLGLLGSWGGVVILLWVKGWAPGLPLSELLASFGIPLAQHTITHTAIYLWGDKLSGLIHKWQTLQRAALNEGIRTHLAWPALSALRTVDAAFIEHLSAMKELSAQCRRV